MQEYALFHKRLRCAFIAGPLFSEFQTVESFRNVLLVCSGTAITPIMGAAQYWEPGDRTVTLVWVVRDKNLIPLLLPAINPATRVIIYFTGKTNGVQDQLTQADLTANNFFRPAETHNPVTALKDDGVVGGVTDQQMGTPGEASQYTDNGMHTDNGIDAEVLYGRPRDLDALIHTYIVPKRDKEVAGEMIKGDPLAQNIVGISTGVIPMASGLEKVCVEGGIPFIRCDASFG